MWMITGGCGFLGSNVTAALLRDGGQVRVVDNLSRIGAVENLAWLRSIAASHPTARLEFVRADVRSRTDVDEAFRGLAGRLRVVAHLAGQVAMTTSVERPRYDFEVNVLGTLNVLEALREYGPEAALLFSSTNKVYGDLETLRYVETASRWTLPGLPFGLDESVPLDFRTPYGCSKGSADAYVREYARSFGLRTVVFRHSSIYGGRQFATFDQGWVGWFCGRALAQRETVRGGRTPVPFTVSGDGKQVRDLLHATDLVTCYRLGAEAALRGDPAVVGQAFNIGGGPENSASLLELFALLEELLGFRPVFETIAPRSSDQRVFIADVRLARERLGFQPTMGIREGVQQMLEWVAALPTVS